MTVNEEEFLQYFEHVANRYGSELVVAATEMIRLHGDNLKNPRVLGTLITSFSAGVLYSEIQRVKEEMTVSALLKDFKMPEDF